MDQEKDFHAVAKMLRLPQVIDRTGRSRSSIYADPDFPRPVPIGAKAVGWVSTEVDKWISERIAVRDRRRGDT